MELTPHQQRVIDEKEELDARLGRLKAFILAHPSFGALPVEEKVRLSEQKVYMASYSNVLGRRIAAFSGIVTAPIVPIVRQPTSITDDPTDPRIKRGTADTEPVEQSAAYLVLPKDERAKGFVRPYRNAYKHRDCTVDPSVVTSMGQALSETYARDPKFYGATYCCACRMHKPVGEFAWKIDGETVGS